MLESFGLDLTLTKWFVFWGEANLWALSWDVSDHTSLIL